MKPSEADSMFVTYEYQANSQIVDEIIHAFDY